MKFTILTIKEKKIISIEAEKSEIQYPLMMIIVI